MVSDPNTDAAERRQWFAHVADFYACELITLWLRQAVLTAQSVHPYPREERIGATLNAGIVLGSARVEATHIQDEETKARAGELIQILGGQCLNTLCCPGAEQSTLHAMH